MADGAFNPGYRFFNRGLVLQYRDQTNMLPYVLLLGLLAKIKGIFRERLWSGWRVGVTRWLSQTGESLTHGGQVVVRRRGG